MDYMPYHPPIWLGAFLPLVLFVLSNISLLYRYSSQSTVATFYLKDLYIFNNMTGINPNPSVFLLMASGQIESASVSIYNTAIEITYKPVLNCVGTIGNLRGVVNQICRIT